MTLPGNIATISLTFRYAPVGPPLAGEVSFRPSVPTLVDATAPAFVLGTVAGKLDPTTGSGSVTLALNDNTTLSPSGWLWEVTESILGLPVRPPYLIRLTADMGPTIDLADPRLTPVNPAPPYSTVYGILANPNVWTALNNFANGLAIGGTTIAPPPGGTTQFLAANGTWQTPPTGGGGLTPIVRDAFITSGSVHFNTDAAFAAYPAIGITIPAVANDNIAITISGMWAKIGGDFCDLAVIVGGTAVRFASSQTATAAIEGVPWLYPDPAYRTCGGVFSFPASAGDIDTDGSIHVALFHKGPAGGTWFADLNYATSIHAVNNRH